MELPTNDDLLQLAYTSPVIANAYALYRTGHYEYAAILRLMVVTLAEQLKIAQDELTKHVMEAPVTYSISVDGKHFTATTKP